MRVVKHAAWLHIVGSLVAAVVAALVAKQFVAWAVAIPLAWVVFVVVYVAWTGLLLWPMSPEETRDHATREDPSRGVSAGALVLAAVGSLGGVALLLMAGKNGSEVALALVGALSVAASWVLVHVVYMLHYARYHYSASGDPKPVDFNDDPEDPDYHDFAYVAFTLGMTFQVSDTAFNTKPIRRLALRHALLSYLLGAVVVACTVNLVAQIASSGGQ